MDEGLCIEMLLGSSGSQSIEFDQKFKISFLLRNKDCRKNSFSNIIFFWISISSITQDGNLLKVHSEAKMLTFIPYIKFVGRRLFSLELSVEKCRKSWRALERL